MDERQKLDFLLGAVSPAGFAGYFDQMLKLRSGWHSLLIKAGPGCGKSTMMNKIAGHLTGRGETVELIHCSSDPDSLDGRLQRPQIQHCGRHRAPFAGAEVPGGGGNGRFPLRLYRRGNHAQASKRGLGPVRPLRRSARARRPLYHRRGSLISDSARVAFAAANLPAARSFAAHLALKYLPRTGRLRRGQ